MSTELTPMQSISLAITHAGNFGLDHEFIMSVLSYLAEHTSAELVDQAIEHASTEWDL